MTTQLAMSILVACLYAPILVIALMGVVGPYLIPACCDCAYDEAFYA